MSDIANAPLFEISRHELEEQSIFKPLATLLPRCFVKFCHQQPQPEGEGGNLVMMWRRDYDALVAPPAPQPASVDESAACDCGHSMATHLAGYGYSCKACDCEHFSLAAAAPAPVGDKCPSCHQRKNPYCSHGFHALVEPSITPPKKERCGACGGPLFRCECCTTAGF